MASPSLPLLLLLLLSLSAASATASSSSSVSTLCKKATFPDLCVSSIQSVAPGITSLDKHTALKHSIQALRVDIQAAKRKAATVPKDQLGTCAVGLNDANADTETALKALEQKDAGATKANLDATVSSLNFCVDESPPMKADAQRCFRLLQNCWSVYDMIWK